MTIKPLENAVAERTAFQTLNLGAMTGKPGSTVNIVYLLPP